MRRMRSWLSLVLQAVGDLAAAAAPLCGCITTSSLHKSENWTTIVVGVLSIMHRLQPERGACNKENWENFVKGHVKGLMSRN